MKRVKPVALVGAGNFTDSSLTRFLRFSDQLGPVKSPSYRLASRISNIFRSGHPVKDYAELDACRLILVCVPDKTLPKVVSEMAASGISWQGKAIVLCSMWLDSSHLSELSAHGGSIGSLSPIPGFEGLEDFRYLVEGDKLAILEAKRLLAHQRQRVIAIERSLKPFYLAALTCTGDLLFALMVAASGIFAACRTVFAGIGRHPRKTVRKSAPFLSEIRAKFQPGAARSFQAVTRLVRRRSNASPLHRAELPHFLAAACRTGPA